MLEVLEAKPHLAEGPLGCHAIGHLNLLQHNSPKRAALVMHYWETAHASCTADEKMLVDSIRAIRLHYTLVPGAEKVTLESLRCEAEAAAEEVPEVVHLWEADQWAKRRLVGMFKRGMLRYGDVGAMQLAQLGQLRAADALSVLERLEAKLGAWGSDTPERGPRLLQRYVESV